MPTIHFRQAAIHDLDKIYRYTVRTWSQAQAEHYYHLLKNACYDLGNGIQQGKNYAHIAPHLLGYRVGKHIILPTEIG